MSGIKRSKERITHGKDFMSILQARGIIDVISLVQVQQYHKGLTPGVPVEAMALAYGAFASMNGKIQCAGCRSYYPYFKMFKSYRDAYVVVQPAHE